MKLFEHIPAWLRNKYFIAFIVFGATLLFFDKNDLFTQRARSRELRTLEKSKLYYESQIAAQKKELDQLKNDPATLEKLAREKYLMKKDNEDVYIIPEKD
ncbi:MAG: septum formation initiator family protein [Terrimonas sp.]|nr:septum formation initiator family protein [Terrimonas sp.]